MLDSSIKIVKPRKRSILGQQLQTGEFCCVFPTGPSNRKHKLHRSGNKTLMKVSRVRLAVRLLSLVATYDIKELMLRDWATLRRRGTFL